MMSTHYYPDLEHFSPVRPLAWRWDRAARLVRCGSYFTRRRDDEQTGRAVHYLRALHRCRTDRQAKRLARRYPDVHAARQLHDHGGTTTLEVQSRVLAGQADDQIARATALPPEAVAAYESLFFHCRDRLDARGWIVTYAIKWLSFDPVKGRDFATVVKAFAYHGGPSLLDAIVPFIRGERSLDLPVADGLVQESETDRCIRLAIGVDMLPWDVNTARKLSRIRVELLADSGKASTERSVAAVLAENVAQSLEQGGADALKNIVGPGPTTGYEAEQSPQRQIA